jgi:hypothetical protein
MDCCRVWAKRRSRVAHRDRLRNERYNQHHRFKKMFHLALPFEDSLEK